MTETVKTGRLLNPDEVTGSEHPGRYLQLIGPKSPQEILDSVRDLRMGEPVLLQVSNGVETRIEQMIVTDDPRKMFIASKSEIKKDALIEGAGTYEVEMIESDSGIDDQPIGMEMIRTGAANRIESAKKNGATGRIFAIENGLIEEDGEWFDVGLVLAYDMVTGNYAVGLTEKVKVPKNIVEEVMKIGPNKTNWGKVIKSRNPDLKIDNQDPHLFVTDGEISRRQLLRNAVREVIRILDQYRA